MMLRPRTIPWTLLCATMLVLGGCSESVFRSGIPPQADESGPGYRGEDPLANDDDDDAAGDDDDGTGGSDVAEILNIDPAPGSSDHHYRRPLRIAFTANAVGTSLSLFAEGVPVPHELSWDADWTTCTMTPLPRLDPATTYTVEVDLYGQGQAWTFTTSDVGLLQSEPASLDAATFVLDTTSAAIVAPAGLGSLGASATLAGSPAVQLTFVPGPDYNRFTMRSGLVTGNEGDWDQDGCASAGSVSIDDDFRREDAFFSASGDSMGFWLGSTLVEVEDAWIEGDFGPDGQSLQEVDVSGFVLASSLDSLSGTEDGCALLSDLLGADCVPCPQADGQCAWFDIEGLSGARSDAQIDDVDGGACSEADVTVWLGCSAAGQGAADPRALLALIGVLGFAVRRRTS